MANQKPTPKSMKRISNLVKMDNRIARKNKDLDKLKQFLANGEYHLVLTHARVALEKGNTEVYRLALFACEKLKDYNSAERIVRLGLKRGIPKILLLRQLANIYLESDKLDRYLEISEIIAQLNAEKKVLLRRFTS